MLYFNNVCFLPMPLVITSRDVVLRFSMPNIIVLSKVTIQFSLQNSIFNRSWEEKYRILFLKFTLLALKPAFSLFRLRIWLYSNPGQEQTCVYDDLYNIKKFASYRLGQFPSSIVALYQVHWTFVDRRTLPNLAESMSIFK